MKWMDKTQNPTEAGYYWKYESLVGKVCLIGVEKTIAPLGYGRLRFWYASKCFPDDMYRLNYGERVTADKLLEDDRFMGPIPMPSPPDGEVA